MAKKEVITQQEHIILSIKPKYAEMIYNGSKKYEFRKRLYPQHVSNCGVPFTRGRIYLYESKPVQKITGFIKVDNYVADIVKTPRDELWAHVKNGAGITKDEFDKYFKDAEMATAWHIKSYHKFKYPVKPEELFWNSWAAPQFYVFITDGLADQLDELGEMTHIIKSTM
jgi:predicted transcriptional regulator